MEYDFIRNATLKKIEKGTHWLKQTNDNNIVDISLNFGQLNIPLYNDFYEEFIKFINRIDDYCNILASLFPFISIEPKNRLHSTLLTVFNDKKTTLDIKNSELFSDCCKISNIFNESDTIRVKFKDVLLTSNGTLILIGESPALMSFRREVYQTIDIPQELHKNIIHITLGRLLVDTENENMFDLYNYLLMHGELDLPELEISRPKFIVCNDLLATEFDMALTTRFNQAWGISS